MNKSPAEEKPNAYLDRGLKQARPAMDANAVRFDEAAIDTGSSYAVVHPEDLAAYRIGETDWYKVNGFLRLTCDVEATGEDQDARVTGRTSPIDSGTVLGTGNATSGGSADVVTGYDLLGDGIEAVKFEAKYNSTDGGTARIAGHFA